MAEAVLKLGDLREMTQAAKPRAKRGKRTGYCWRCGRPAWILTGYVCDLGVRGKCT